MASDGCSRNATVAAEIGDGRTARRTRDTLAVGGGVVAEASWRLNWKVPTSALAAFKLKVDDGVITVGEAAVGAPVRLLLPRGFLCRRRVVVPAAPSEK